MALEYTPLKPDPHSSDYQRLMYYAADSFIFSDGQFITADQLFIDPFSQTFHYGNGVFEGLRAYQTDHGPRIFKPRAHFERFLDSAQRLGLKVDYTVEELINISYELLEKNKLSNAYLRPLLYAAPNMALTSHQQASHLMIGAFQWGKLLGDNLVHLKISNRLKPDPDAFPIEGKICGIYVNNIMATTEARSEGYHEALMMNSVGEVVQAAGANLFVEKDEVLYTPPAKGIMAGITRETVMEMAQEMGISVREQAIRPEFLYEADGAFLTGTAVEITGVATIDRLAMHHPWEETIGHLLARKYRQIVTHAEPFKWTLI